MLDNLKLMLLNVPSKFEQLFDVLLPKIRDSVAALEKRIEG